MSAGSPCVSSSPDPSKPGATRSGRRAKSSHPYVILTGNPNCGKTTLFNALTGLRAKVGNYAGVTVERKEGKLLGAPTGYSATLLDLPGTYSLSPQSLDEQISRDVLLSRVAELPEPSLVVIVVDASNLQRNLYYATQVIELGHPTMLALNMVDVAESNGQQIDTGKLSNALGVKVVPLVASTGQGVAELRREMVAMTRQDAPAKPRRFASLPESFLQEAEVISGLLTQTFEERRAQAFVEACLILGNEKALASSLEHYPPAVQQAVEAARRRLEAASIDWRGASIEGRYAAISAIQQQVTTELAPQGETFSDKLDRILTHKVWGTAMFVLAMGLMFQSIFTFAELPMNALQAAVDWAGGLVATLIPPGDLNSLLVDGVIAGVGAVVVFLPQILLLFLFIGFLEDTGYMARAAFLMDRLMSKVGLHGKSFIPLLSSFACAIPGIMATRTIESRSDRLVTILVAPLMSCSARLPVYTVLIAACIPDIRVLGVFKLAGLTMLGMYLLGITVALLMAWLFKKTLLKGEPPLLIMELPPYKRPLLRVILRHMWERGKIFLKQAGTIILGINIILWFLASYPRDTASEQFFQNRKAIIENQQRANPEQREEQLSELHAEQSAVRLHGSWAGQLGRIIEPVIAPLGFDWRIGIGIVSSFAAREVFVSTMSTVYNVGDFDDSTDGISSMAHTLRSQTRPDGTPVFTTLTALTLMVFYVFALQCVSTIAVVKRETNSWKWPVFQWAYMAVLAWVMAYITLQIGRSLGL